jgi:hypothetical protein
MSNGGIIMNTTKPVLGFAVMALALSTAAPAQDVARNFTASSQYWVWVDAMQTTADLTMPKEADVGRSNPLHPAFYAARIDDSKRLDGKASERVQISEIRNPLHPQYYLR